MATYVRKTSIGFSALLFAIIMVLVIPYQQVKAGPLVGGAPAGAIVGGAGVYVGTALITAGIAGLIGYDEYQEEINAHAARVWDGSTQLAKDSLKISVEMAQSAGTGLVSLEGNFLNYIDSQLANLSTSAVSITMPYENVTADTTISSSLSSSTTKKVAGSKLAYAANGQLFDEVRVTYSGDTESWAYAGTSFFKNGVMVFSKNFSNADGQSAMRSIYRSKIRELFESGSVTTEKIISLASTMSAYSVSTVPAELWEQKYPTYRSNVQQAWESMRDAGLVLPVDSAVPYSAEAQPLNYDAQAGTYTGIDGTPYTGDVSWRMPGVKWRDQSDSISTPGVYVDTPALTGNPAYDEPIIKNPAIPKTTTNVFTGTTVANPDIPIEAAPTVPVEPVPGTPDFAKPGSKSINWTPFLRSGTLMAEKFPFSIPFDFVRQLEVLNVEPEAPTFKINVEDYLKIGGFTIPFKMDLSFEMFDPIANIIRWGLIIIFDISLIFGIRKFLPE